MPSLAARMMLLRDESKDWTIYSTSTFVAEAPAINVQHKRPRVFGRSTDTTSGTPTSVYLDVGAGNTIDPDEYVFMPMYIRHDGDLGSLEYRLRTSNNSNLSSPTFDSGAAGTAIDDPWSDRDHAHAIINPFDDDPTITASRYIGLDLWVTSGSYIDVGRIVMGQPYQPSRGEQFGVGLPSPIEEPIRIGGSRGEEFSTGGKVYMRTEGVLLLSSESEARDELADIRNRVGTNQDVVYVYDPTDSTLRQQGIVYGRFERLEVTRVPQRSLFGVRHAISEIH